MDLIDKNKIKNCLVEMDARLNNIDMGLVIHSVLSAINKNEFNLDKPVLPENIAGYLEELKSFGIDEPWEMIAFLTDVDEPIFLGWIKKDSNVDKFLLGVLFVYEVEKEKKYRIPMPNMRTVKNGEAFLTKLKDDVESPYKVLGMLSENNSEAAEIYQQSFTAEEADNLPEPYNNPDVFPRVEVDD